MIVHNLGSINIDLVFRVPHIPAPGETLLSYGMSRGLGGKGANTSIALAQAGASTYHYGAIGSDGNWILDALKDKGVDCSNISELSMPSGQAIIQVDDQGENAITLLKGANWGIGTNILDDLFENAVKGDWLVLQNETDHVALAAKTAKGRGVNVAYAAAPFDADATTNVLPFVDFLALNEIEAAQLEKHTSTKISDLSPRMILVTRGSKGAILYQHGRPELSCAANRVENVRDTTGAGDTFFGFFLGTLTLGIPIEECMKIASAAAAVSVTEMGAASAIPNMSQVNAFLRDVP